MKLMMVGINFRTAPVELRERLSFRANEVPGVLQRIKWEMQDSEMVLLSTCNRTELYVAGADVDSHKDALAGYLAKSRELPVDDTLKTHFYRKENLEAVTHLFGVTASLDSMVVGETEILGQVKQAYTIASEAGTTGRLLNPLFQNAFKVAKRIHNETDICHGRVSVSSIAVEFTEKIFDDLSTKTVMIIGAGETSELTLQALIQRGARSVLVVNRSLERGRALADQCGGKAIQFDLMDDYLPQADIVISSTNAPHAVLRVETVRKAIAVRHSRPMLLIDIAVPRDIEEGVGALENVYLYNIDDLQLVASENLSKRQEAIDPALSIIHEGMTTFEAWFRVQNFGSLIHEIEESSSAIKDAELSRAFSKDSLAALPDGSKEAIRAMLNRTINRILASPKVALKHAARNGHGEEYVKVVRHLFGLDREGHDDNK